jgi:predicted aldo/keto reductase-like oxidoreductase
MYDMKRRNFIRATALAAPSLSLFPADLSSIIREPPAPGKIEKRSFGKTGEMLSMIAFGGIIVMDATPEQAAASVKLGIDAGVNHFDVAPSYGDAEIKLGPALEPYRKGSSCRAKPPSEKRKMPAVNSNNHWSTSGPAISICISCMQ